ncbi:MAG: NADP-dependent isocitrate dehydrogenase [Rhodospirillaceae bacterium]|nr:NADP-dependent isocitrate dehydrogenase [Rhodospirillaceae bacterium]
MDHVSFIEEIDTPPAAKGASRVPVSVAWGDGIGPEIMRACLRVMLAAGARIDVEPVEIGEREYRRGTSGGINAAAWSSIKSTGILFKAPLTTPQGGGVKSVNVTLRKTLGMFANVRPCVSLSPYVAARAPKMDLVIVRENEEDLYGGIEHRQTEDVVQCLKLISRPGCERVVRYAFEYARTNGRRKVTCLTKDNIMKLTDGLFHRVFDEVAADYPELAAEHLIVDIGTARLASRPELFDVVVTPNLYGDIISDVAAEIAGSVGLAGSANIGAGAAMFEAVHGSAPDIAEKDIANPSGLLQAGIMLLAHIGQGDVAETIRNAWLRTIEDGIHTADIAGPGRTRQQVGTRDFASAVIARLGSRPIELPAARPQARVALPAVAIVPRRRAEKRLVGVDVFVGAQDTSPEGLAARMHAACGSGLSLAMITNRGVKVWPEGHPDTVCVDHWRCRLTFAPEMQGNLVCAMQAIARLARTGLDVIKVENLYTFDGQPGFSQGQGQ